MISTTSGCSRRPDLRVRPALLAMGLGALLFAGCSSSSVDVVNKGATPTASTKTATTKTNAKSSAPTVAVETAPAGSTGGAPAADGAAVLKHGLDVLRPAYELTETVTVDGKVALTVTGRVVGPTSAFTLTSTGASVDYLEVPPHSWSREQGGSWLELAAPVPVKSPLDALGQPSNLTVTSQQVSESKLHATYDPALFATTGNPIEADLVIGADNTLTATYPTTVSGKAGSVVAKLVPATDTTPLQPPS